MAAHQPPALTVRAPPAGNSPGCARGPRRSGRPRTGGGRGRRGDRGEGRIPLGDPPVRVSRPPPGHPARPASRVPGPAPERLALPRRGPEAEPPRGRVAAAGPRPGEAWSGAKIGHRGDRASGRAGRWAYDVRPEGPRPPRRTAPVPRAGGGAGPRRPVPECRGAMPGMRCAGRVRTLGPRPTRRDRGRAGCRHGGRVPAGRSAPATAPDGPRPEARHPPARPPPAGAVQGGRELMSDRFGVERAVHTPPSRAGAPVHAPGAAV